MRILSFLFPLLIVTSLLAACAPVGPDYRPPSPDLPAAWNAPVAEPQGSGRWWNIFADELLTDLVAEALTANQDLRIATSRITAARANYRIAAAAATPSVEGTAGYSRSGRPDQSDGDGTTSGNRDLFEAGFDANWELDFWGGQRRAIEAAGASLAATGENRRDVLISLEAEVARNYYELRASQRRLTTASNNLANQEMTLSIVQGRFDLGLASRLEVAEAVTQKSLLAAQLPALQTRITNSISALALLLDTYPTGLRDRLAEPGPAPQAPLLLPAGLPSDLMRRRPDIRRAERQLASATAAIGMAEADLFPRFSLTGLVGLQSSEIADLLGSGSELWSFGPSVRLPIFNRDKLRAAVDIRQAEQEETLAVYQQTVLAAIIETEEALDRFSREQASRDNLEEGTRAGREAMMINEGLYRNGLADLTDVLASQRILYQAEDQLIQSHEQLALAIIRLYKALGGGWELAEAAMPGSAPAGENFTSLRQ